MEGELTKLQTRVEELEAALAAISKKKSSANACRVPSLPFLICVVIVAIGAALAHTAGAGATSAPQAPTKVYAPFQVWDKDKLLFSVQEEPGGGGAGAVFIFTKDGAPAVEILASGEGNGAVSLMNKGTERVSVGIAGNGAGLLVLKSAGQAATQLNGAFGARQTNAQGQPSAQWGVDDSNNGYFMAAGRAGRFLSRLTTDEGGSTGRVEVMGSDEVKVLMGVKENGKGDVCANGAPGKQVCFSGLAIKTLTPF